MACLNSRGACLHAHVRAACALASLIRCGAPTVSKAARTSTNNKIAGRELAKRPSDASPDFGARRMTGYLSLLHLNPSQTARPSMRWTYSSYPRSESSC